MSIELVNWLKDGNYRIPILKLLNNKNHLSSELAKHFEVNRASMSRILKALEKKELVESISSGSRTVTYVITEKGKTVIGDL
ncbi:MAG: MarR family transcriptional regulator [Nanoarchaeota archaeon]